MPGIKAPFALALALVALTPAAASASTIDLSGDVLTITAAPGEQNSFDIRPNDDDSGVLVQDRGVMPSDPGGRCTVYPWSSNTLDCGVQPATIRIDAGDGDDKAYLVDGFPGTRSVAISGGDGADHLTASFNLPTTVDGGAGDDTISGSLANDVLTGGPGNDKLDGLRGNDEVRGGDGDDSLRGDNQSGPFADTIDGGAGYDTIQNDWLVALTDAQQPVTVTLDGVANDGRAGEGDNVTSVERIHLTFAGSLTAAGDAVDFEVFNYASGSSRLVGSPGADRLRSYDQPDAIDAGAGDDWIEAGYGDDDVTGGPGRDTINADAGSGACNFLVCRTPQGNDTVRARDGEADSIECGPGTDTAIVDAVDVVSNCETVDKPPVTGGGGTPPGGGGTTNPPAAKKCKVPKVKSGAKLKTVQTSLKKANCKAKVVKQRHRTVKTGRVIKLSAKAGRTLAPGSTVKVYVSRGKR